MGPAEASAAIDASQSALHDNPKHKFLSYNEVTLKRKRDAHMPDRLDGHAAEPTDMLAPNMKRRKNMVDPSPLEIHIENPPIVYGLCPDIWQQVFTYLPPASLARILRVSKMFGALLCSPSVEFPSGIPFADLDPQGPSSEWIWKMCHRRFTPGLPSPLKLQTENSMWKLIKGTRCHQCGQTKALQTLSSTNDPWTAGPNENCVRVIWPFRVRLCAPCLQSTIRKEKDLILDSTYPSFLVDGLSFVFMLESGDCISESLLRETSVPLGMKPTKIYYQPQIDSLKRLYQEVKSNDPVNLQHWIEALPSIRRSVSEDTMRWETWEQKGILARINSRTRDAKIRPAKPSPAANPLISPPTGQAGELKTTEVVLLKEPSVLGGISNRSMPANLLNNNHQSSVPNGSDSREAVLSSAEITKNSRRHEIERRALELDPPLSSSILERMECFHAALSIAKELDDQQWGILKHRIHSERLEVESRSVPPSSAMSQSTQCESVLHGENLPASRAVPLKDSIVVDSADVHLKEHANSNEEEQNALADRLQQKLWKLADQVIVGKWNGGSSLNKDSCFQFAAEVLTATRKTYYSTSDFQASPPYAGFPPRLTLENMKWLFDTRIRPLTEQHQRDIFFCHACGNAGKTYGFEAVIQHYAAKHTKSLSLGSVVVHWKAEWPEFPPFHPQPSLMRALTLTASSVLQRATSVDQNISSSLSQEASFDTSASRDQTRVTTSFLSQQAEPTSAYPAMQGSNDHVWSLDQSQIASHRSQVHNDSEPAYQEGAVVPLSTDTAFHTLVRGQVRPSADRDVSRPAAGAVADFSVPTTETFRVHQAEMAKLARDFWFATAGVKGLPGAVRVQTIIHHACEQFVNRFQLEPGVNMFLFGLNHEASMRPLRTLFGFSCRSCCANLPGSLPPHERRQSSTLPHLLNHFMYAHAEFHGLDWRKDMIQLPPTHIIADLVNCPGMDDAKFSLLAAALPGAFPFPAPPLSALQQSTSTRAASNVRNTKPDEFFSLGDQASNSHLAYHAGYSGIITSGPPVMQEEQPQEDEYDPRRPTYIGRIVGGGHHGSPAMSPTKREVQFSDTRREEFFVPQLNTRRDTRAASQVENFEPYPDNDRWDVQRTHHISVRQSQGSNQRVSSVDMNVRNIAQHTHSTDFYPMQDHNCAFISERQYALQDSAFTPLGRQEDSYVTTPGQREVALYYRTEEGLVPAHVQHDTSFYRPETSHGQVQILGTGPSQHRVRVPSMDYDHAPFHSTHRTNASSGQETTRHFENTRSGSFVGLDVTPVHGTSYRTSQAKYSN